MKVSYYLKKSLNNKIKELLNNYLKIFGDEEVSLIRVPARINLLGTHIDHQGGYVNYLTVDKELWCVAGERKDNKIVCYNLDKKYNWNEFALEKYVPERKVDWIEFIKSIKITPGDWINYIKAPISYIQNEFPEKKLRGMNFYFYGEVPVGAGLSSSSAILVATMLSICKINRLDIKKEKLVEMCGRAEWYVGTRGGSGDHAAMIFGEKNKITHIQFFPFTIEYIPFPEEYQIICCNSLIEAKKSENAKSIFNERIASYEIGFKLIKKGFPEFKDKIKYLRDINPENLGDEEIIYKMLLSLPENVSRKDILKVLPEEDLKTIFKTHNEPIDGYKLREVIMYGISECERAKKCAEFLKEGRIDQFGKFMFISHDGDRVVKYSNNGKIKKWKYNINDEILYTLIKNLKSPDMEEREKARIYNQPGGYRCSTLELDFIVDLVKQISGVKGAKLTGAGLGGCVLILVEKEMAEKVIEILNEKYYKVRNLPESSFICNSVNGAEFL